MNCGKKGHNGQGCHQQRMACGGIDRTRESQVSENCEGDQNPLIGPIDEGRENVAKTVFNTGFHGSSLLDTAFEFVQLGRADILFAKEGQDQFTG